MSPRRLPVLAVGLAVLAAGCSGAPSPETPSTLVLASPNATNATSTSLLPTSRFAIPDFTPATFEDGKKLFMGSSGNGAPDDAARPDK